LVGGRIGQQTVDCGFSLPSSGGEVQTQDMKDPEKRPEFGRRNVSLLMLADDFADFVAITDGLCTYKPRGSQSIFEVASVGCGARTVQEVAEISEQGVAPPLYHDGKTIA
jgi:hypothetical protein